MGIALSGRLQASLRFLRHPLPPGPSPFLAVGLPPERGGHGVYPVYRDGDPSWGGWTLSPSGTSGCRRRQRQLGRSAAHRLSAAAACQPVLAASECRALRRVFTFFNLPCL